MDLLQGYNFHCIDQTDNLLLKEQNSNLNSLLIRYAGMGYYYVFFEKVFCLNEERIERRYVIILLGGSNSYDRNDTEKAFKNYTGSYYTIEECIRYCKNLIEP